MTPAQLAAIKADIAANPDLNAYPNNSDGSYEIARLYNLTASPQQLVWRTDAPVQAIYDAIDWTKFTPVDVPDATSAPLATARLLAIQTKQMNLQNMLQGRTTVDASKANIRAGLRDAVVALPAGANGAAVTAGGASGATVLAACVRPATRMEKLLKLSDATTGSTTAALLGFEGACTYQDIDAARA